MAEYIDREAVHEAIEKAPTGCWGSEGHVVYADDAHKQIDDIPAADVRPVVHGKWKSFKLHGAIDYPYYACSECDVVAIAISPFCPNCGADMREKEES